MDSASWLYISLLVLMILMSSFFSASEMAVSSLNRIRIKNLAKDGNKKAILVLNLYEKYDRLLSTILIGNTIVNIASASIATVIFVKYYGDIGVTISTVAMTIIVLIFGEITPKSLAKDFPESFAMFSSRILQVFIIILLPINFFFTQWQKLLSRMFKVGDERRITEEELLTIVEEAESDGGIDFQDGELIRSAIEFNDLDVLDILTPRVEVVAIDENTPQEEIRQIFFDTGFSRLPVFKGTVDNIIGVINLKDFTHFITNTDKSINCIIKPIAFIRSSMKISRLLTMFQNKKYHMAVVFDEYGGTAGIVTLEDVLEELVGEIWDEHDEVVDSIEKISEDEYNILAKLNPDKMFELFNLKRDFNTSTVSGWIIEELRKVPKPGDVFTYENLTIAILKADARHVVEINVVRNK